MQAPSIIFENEEILVLDKPAGCIVNAAQTTTNQPVVQTWLENNFNYPLAKSIEFRSGIVHRLDKETSGLLIIAKNQTAFENLQLQFKERGVTKTYLALTHGKVGLKQGIIDAPVGRLPWRRDRFGVLPGGREAQTNYELVNTYQNEKEDFSFLTLKPKTGRTHQIRIHLKHLGHPIVADEFYAGRKTARHDRLWCPRLFLHAEGISFKDPKSNQDLSFKSPLPEELSGALGKLTLT